ncbi:MAG: HAD-IB family phosphatase [Desulfobacterales bacterium]
MTDSAKDGKNPYVFCDFDGTITAQESLQAVFEHFVPDQWADVKHKLVSGELTLRRGVRQMIESIPSARYPAVLSFVREIPLRPGLSEFLDFLEACGIAFVIVSGGVRGMVEAGLGSLISRVHRVFAADVDDSGSYLQVRSEFEGVTELVDKVSVMNRFPADPRIVIGDGMTDQNMARSADLVFARGRLARYLEEGGHDYIKWGDFFDIRNDLIQRMGKVA